MTETSRSSPTSPGGLVPRQMRDLDVDECLAVLARQRVGRLAFVHGGRPQILPMNYVVDQGSVVIRTDYGSTLDAVVRSHVAFEVDELTPSGSAGCSVVVHGRADEVWEPEDLDTVRQLPLRPWAPGARAHFIRIAPSAITGRRIV